MDTWKICPFNLAWLPVCPSVRPRMHSVVRYQQGKCICNKSLVLMKMFCSCFFFCKISIPVDLKKSFIFNICPFSRSSNNNNNNEKKQTTWVFTYVFFCWKIWSSAFIILGNWSENIVCFVFRFFGSATIKIGMPAWKSLMHFIFVFFSANISWMGHMVPQGFETCVALLHAAFVASQIMWQVSLCFFFYMMPCWNL